MALINCGVHTHELYRCRFPIQHSGRTLRLCDDLNMIAETAQPVGGLCYLERKKAA